LDDGVLLAASGSAVSMRHSVLNSKQPSGGSMPKDKTDKSFPAIHLAETPSADTPGELRQRELKELAGRLDQFHAFAKGEFVKWKPGLKNRKFPDHGEPAIITAVLSIPVFDPCENGAASPYFQEPLTLIIGTYRDDDLLEFHVDGRRFEPFEL
jgi:hypothetical protein